MNIQVPNLVSFTAHHLKHFSSKLKREYFITACVASHQSKHLRDTAVFELTICVECRVLTDCVFVCGRSSLYVASSRTRLPSSCVLARETVKSRRRRAHNVNTVATRSASPLACTSQVRGISDLVFVCFWMYIQTIR